MSLQFFFSKSVREIIKKHPDNRNLWNAWVIRQEATLFLTTTFEMVFEKFPPKGIKTYCYFSALDSQNRLVAFMPGYFTSSRTRIFYGKQLQNRIGKILAKILLKIPAIRHKLPEQTESFDLVVGHDMEKGQIFWSGETDLTPIFDCLFAGISEIANQTNVTTFSFQDLTVELTQQFQDTLKGHSFIKKSGDGFTSIPVAQFENFGAFLEHIEEAPDSIYGRRQMMKMLSSNFVPPELKTYLSKKRMGFPPPDDKNQFKNTQEKARWACRRRQTEAWLKTEKVEDLIPTNERINERRCFLDDVSSLLLKDGWIGDLRYEIWPVNPQNLDAVFHLWEAQNQKYGLKEVYIDREWFLAMEKYAQGECLLQVILCGESPVGFYFIYFHSQIFFTMFLGFDPFLGPLHNLYFHIHLQSWIEAKKRNAEKIILGPGDDKINYAKRNIGAQIERSYTFIRKKGFKQPFQVEWTKLRWFFRKFKIKIGRLEAYADSYFTPYDETPAIPEETHLGKDLLQKIRTLADKYKPKEKIQ